jgi:hypothetical protein
MGKREWGAHLSQTSLEMENKKGCICNRLCLSVLSFILTVFLESLWNTVMLAGEAGMPRALLFATRKKGALLS